jgi:hypothetical protein
MKMLILLLFVSLGGYAQQVTVTKVNSTELPKTKIMDLLLQNDNQTIYKVTDINTLEATEIQVTKPLQLVNFSIYETSKPVTKEEVDTRPQIELYNPYKSVKSGITPVKVPEFSTERADIYKEWGYKKKEN